MHYNVIIIGGGPGGVDGLKERHGVAYGVHGEDDLLASDAELARDLLDRGLALLLALELFTRL